MFQAFILDEGYHFLVKLSCKSTCENLNVSSERSAAWL